MFRLLFSAFLLYISSYASESAFQSCQQKVIDLNVIAENELSLFIAKDKQLIYSSIKPSNQILKENPFLHLYLVKTEKRSRYSFLLNKKNSSNIGIVNQKSFQKLKTDDRQIGLNHFSKIKNSISTPSILTTKCCQLEGIVTTDGVIERAYIERFLNSSKSEYGDIGVRVKQLKNSIVVESIDPYRKNNPFLQGDVIISFNAKRVKDIALFMKEILFSHIGHKYSVEILRGTKKVKFEVESYKRYGGGYLSDTYLEQKGLYFSKDLILITVDKRAKKYQLKVGDKLIGVNCKDTQTQEEVRKNISEYKDVVTLVIQRDGFQFFVKIKE